ncbi:MAG TPA: carbohydrate ABC transporter permease, partial [Chloroflexota bacterium]|nr:carbohydrate ABC transporter permease [Chloroflexota bacterium]
MSSTTRSVLSTIESPSTVARRLSVVRRHWRQLGLHVIFLAISVLYLLPLLWMLSTSLTLSGRELSIPPHFIPDPIVWHNYLEAVTVEPMLTFLRNTLLIGVTATSAGLLSSSLAGYAFARLRFPGRDLLFGACLATLMLPGVVTLIPQFLVFKEVG